MTYTHQPIETRYAGCRFRSRLEARWAVVFDTYGTQWEHEPGTLPGPYLPDFYLPEFETYAEVKGGPEHVDLERLRHATAATNLRIVVLGPVNRTDDSLGYVAHPQVHGDGTIRPFSFERSNDVASPELAAAYEAGRSARFEHGESGATPRQAPPYTSDKGGHGTSYGLSLLEASAHAVAGSSRDGPLGQDGRLLELENSANEVTVAVSHGLLDATCAAETLALAGQVCGLSNAAIIGVLRVHGLVPRLTDTRGRA